MMTGLLKMAIGRTRMTMAVFVLLILAGLITYNRLPKEAMPSVAVPLIYVAVNLEGIAPDDSERLLVRPIEEEIRNIEGIAELRSTAYQGGANIIIEFDPSIDIDVAMEDVRAYVDRARPELPEDVIEPRVTELDFTNQPVLTVSLSGDLPERTFLNIARSLRDQIKALPSVLEVDISGVREEQVEVIVDPVMLDYYGINNDDLFNRFNRSNRLVAAGNLDTGQGKFAVTVPGLFEDVNDIWSLPVLSTDEATVTLSDIADVRRTFKDRTNYVRVDGKPAVSLDITRRADSNVVNMNAAIRDIITREQANLSDQLVVSYPYDASIGIVSRVVGLQNSVMAAVIIVMSACMAFLGLRSGLLVGIAIPGSFLTGIMLMGFMGITINVMALFGLILAVGMLVDGAIVVVEKADRFVTEGLTPDEAYAKAAQAMAWPIISSTGTTIAAFTPLLLWPGVTGQFFSFLPLTLICVLSASMLMALIFVPVIGAQWKKRVEAEGPRLDVIDDEGRHAARKLDPFTRGYVAVLDKALNNPGKVLIGTVAMLFLSIAAYGVFGKGVVFFPAGDPEGAIVTVHARGNLSIDEQDRFVREVEQFVIGVDDIEAVYTRTGSPVGAGGDAAPDQIGEIDLQLKPWNQRRTADEILTELLDNTASLAGIQVITEKLEDGPPRGRAVQMEISGPNSDALPGVIARLRDGMAEVGGFINIEDNRPLPGIEWQLQVDRAEAAKYNADLTTIGQSVRLVTNGLKLGEYRPDDSDEEIDIVVRFPVDQRSVSQLDDIRVETGQGPVPIGNFVQRVAVQQAGDISRIDGQRVLTLSADAAPGFIAAAQVGKFKGWIAQAGLPQDVNLVFKGEEADTAESGGFLASAFLFAMFLMAIILLAQFNSFYAVGLVLSAVIMSTIGVFLGLLITGTPFSVVMTGIGIIALAGIVVNNNIVLIDTFQHERDKHGSLKEALLETGAQRLRPVLLTTGTTALGLVPMAMALGIDFGARTVIMGSPDTLWWRYLAQAIISGLLFSTALTLVVTPCALQFRGNVEAGVKGLWVKLKDRFGLGKTEETPPAPQPIIEAAE